VLVCRYPINIMNAKPSFKELITGSKPVLVDFSAEWCGPCKMMQPILKELAGKVGDTVSIIKIDTDRNSALAGSYQINSVPTLILFQNGQVRWRQSGVMTATQLEQQIRAAVQ
jgi:thioredoxin 1